MVDANTTLFPLLGPIGTVVNTIKVLIGGAFGLYLIILYFRIREYIVVRRLLTSIRTDIRELAFRQGIELEPVKKTGDTLREYLKERMRKKKRKEKEKIAAKKK